MSATTTSQVPEVIDYLVSACQSSPLLGKANPQVYVFDGPQPPAATQSLERVLWIGADPANLGVATGDSAQSWPVLDFARTKDEDGTVTCAAQHWSGDPSNKVHRDGAAEILAGLEVMLRGMPQAGGPGDASMGGLVQWSGLDAATWYPRQIAGGTACLVVFTVIYRARLNAS